MLTERHLLLSLVYLLWLLASWRLLTWSPSHSENPQGLSYLPHTAQHNTHREQLIQWTFDRQSHSLPSRRDSRLTLLIRSVEFSFYSSFHRETSEHLGQNYFMYSQGRRKWGEKLRLWGGLRVWDAPKSWFRGYSCSRSSIASINSTAGARNGLLLVRFLPRSLHPIEDEETGAWPRFAFRGSPMPSKPLKDFFFFMLQPFSFVPLSSSYWFVDMICFPDYDSFVFEFKSEYAPQAAELAERYESSGSGRDGLAWDWMSQICLNYQFACK